MMELQKIELKLISDIEEILSLSQESFNKWYTIKRSTTEKLLRDFEIIANIPNLSRIFRSY